MSRLGRSFLIFFFLARLPQAGVERARGLIAALASDADNLFVRLSAKWLNPRIFVASRAVLARFSPLHYVGWTTHSEPRDEFHF